MLMKKEEIQELKWDSKLNLIKVGAEKEGLLLGSALKRAAYHYFARVLTLSCNSTIFCIKASKSNDLP